MSSKLLTSPSTATASRSSATEPRSTPSEFGATAPNTTIQNVQVTGFGAGIHVDGANSVVDSAMVYDCQIRGIGVAGGGAVVSDCIVGNIATEPILLRRGRRHCLLGQRQPHRRLQRLWNQRAITRAVAYVVRRKRRAHRLPSPGPRLRPAGRSESGCRAAAPSRCRIPTVYSYDEAIGNTGPVNIQSSTISGYSESPFGGPSIVTITDSNVSWSTPNNSAYIAGTADRDHHHLWARATTSSSGLAAQIPSTPGQATISSPAAPGNVLSIIPDFTPGQDKISTAYYAHHNNSIQNGSQATGSQGTMLFNPDNKHAVLRPRRSRDCLRRNRSCICPTLRRCRSRISIGTWLTRCSVRARRRPQSTRTAARTRWSTTPTRPTRQALAARPTQ